MEQITRHITLYVSQVAEIVAAIIIGVAILKVVINSLLAMHRHATGVSLPLHSAEQSRIGFGSSVAVALELLLGADVLATAVAPSWNDIGQLAAIATIRTILNFFLDRELKQVNHIQRQ